MLFKYVWCEVSVCINSIMQSIAVARNTTCHALPQMNSLSSFFLCPLNEFAEPLHSSGSHHHLPCPSEQDSDRKFTEPLI